MVDAAIVAGFDMTVVAVNLVLSNSMKYFCLKIYNKMPRTDH